MALQFNGSAGIPESDQIVTVDGGDGRLTSHLTIKPPEDSAKTPPILSFKRKREIEIPWGDIFSRITSDSPVSVAALRTYFERSWAYDNLKSGLKNSKDLLFNDGNVRQLTPPGEGAPGPVYLATFDEPSEPLKEITEGFVLRHGGSGRLYHIIASAAGLTADHFISWKRYDALWQDYVHGVELVFATKDEASKYYTDYEEIDLRPVVIDRKFGELALVKQFATDVKGKVTAVTGPLIDKIVQSTLNADEIEVLQRRVLRLQIGEFDAQRRIDRLVSQAASLGFVLLPKGGEVDAPELGAGKKKQVGPGLYTQYTRAARWTTSHTRTESYRSGWWIFSTKKTRQVTDTRQHEQQVQDFKHFDAGKDLLSEKRKELVGKGMEVFVFDRSPAGFVTLDGTPLQRVMERCDFDEEFRRSCAVVLPVYEESLIGDRIVAKYSVFKRPLPGILPTMLPRLALEESLSYRTAWQETQLGELVSSINLAPGEERKVIMTKTFRQETTVSRSTTSVFDIAQTESTDLATEMENQVRQESQQSNNLQFSTKASGSYGFMSAEATASGGTSHSLNEVSQAISKVARKAALSVSQQNREEVSSTSTARTEVTNTDQTTATLTNINQGRSLNLMFYRLYNKFKGGLFLDGLGFTVIPGVELIAGSGVHESRSFSLQDLASLMHEFDDDQLPFDIPKEQRKEYKERVLDSIQALLRREYGKDTETTGEKKLPGANAATAKGAESPPASASLSVGRLNMPAPVAKPAVPRARVQKSAKDEDGAVEGLAEFTEALRHVTIDSDEPMVPQELLVATPGLYLDSAVGASPATEPYSELRREQEVRMRQAEVFAKESEGIYQRAQASRLANLSNINWLTGYLPSPDTKSLTLSLELPLQPGNWVVMLNGDKLVDIDKQWHFKRVVTVDLPGRSKDLLVENTDQLRTLEIVDESEVQPKFIRFLNAG